MNDIIGSALRQLAAATIAAIVTGVLHWVFASPTTHSPRREAAVVPMVLHVPLQQTL